MTIIRRGICWSLVAIGAAFASPVATARDDAASEIASLLAEDPETFRALRAPVRRVCAVPVPVPYSPPLEQAALPRRADIKNAVYEVLKEPVRSL